MSVIRYVTSARNSHFALWMVIIGVTSAMSEYIETRVSKELRAAIDDTIVEYLQVFKDCTKEDIQNALKSVLEDYQ